MNEMMPESESESESEFDELRARIRDREPAALAEYIQQRRHQLIAYIQRKMSTTLSRKVDADDMLQDVSAAALRSLPEYDIGDRDPFGWLCQLADRRIVDSHRRFASQKRAVSREVAIDANAPNSSQGGIVNLLVASITSPSQAFSRNQREFQLMAALEQLDEVPREALRLRYVEGLATKEIAERLSKTDGAIRVILSRSLSRLEQIMQADSGS